MPFVNLEIARDDEELVELAVKAYRGALEKHSRETLPLDWAMTQNNLGNALHYVGRLGRGIPSAFNQAVDAYHAALEECTASACLLVGR